MVSAAFDGHLVAAGEERRGGYVEQPLLTVGDCFRQLKAFLNGNDEGYSAKDVLDYLLRDYAAAPTPA